MSAAPSPRRAAALGVAATALAAGAVFGPQAAASAESAQTSCAIGMVPLTNQDTWLRADPGFTQVLYTVAAGRAVRISAGPVEADGLLWWFAHGNDTGNGWVPDQNLTCS